MTTNPHAVTVEVDIDAPGTEDESRTVTAVDFTCTAPPDAKCRTYPDCGDERFGCGHPAVTGRSCWIKDWFDADIAASAYEGPDANQHASDCHVPAVARTGPVEITGFDEGPTWKWATK